MLQLIFAHFNCNDSICVLAFDLNHVWYKIIGLFCLYDNSAKVYWYYSSFNVRGSNQKFDKKGPLSDSSNSKANYYS